MVKIVAVHKSEAPLACDFELYQADEDPKILNPQAVVRLRPSFMYKTGRRSSPEYELQWSWEGHNERLELKDAVMRFVVMQAAHALVTTLLVLLVLLDHHAFAAIEQLRQQYHPDYNYRDAT